MSLPDRDLLAARNGFAIVSNPDLNPIFPMEPPAQPIDECPVLWETYGDGQMRCLCQTSRKIGIARFTVGKPPRLWVEMCLDFDNHLCVHIRTFERALRYLNTESISIRELCDSKRFPNLRDDIDKYAMETLRSGKGCKMTVLPDHDSRLPTYFLRCKSSFVACCQVPGTAMSFSPSVIRVIGPTVFMSSLENFGHLKSFSEVDL